MVKRRVCQRLGPEFPPHGDHPHAGTIQAKALSSALARIRVPALTLALVLALAVVTSPAWSQGPLPVSLGEPIQVARPFITHDTKAGTPRGISGFACLPPDQGQQGQQGRRACLAINDEERFAEWAWFDGSTLTPTGELLELLSKGKQPDDAIIGTRPRGLCAKDQGFGEFDGEAIAIAGDQVYLTGSHACSRAKGQFRPSSFILARARAEPREQRAGEVERTWRVADVLRHSPLAATFGRPGSEGAGIEGLAVVGDRLYLGLRTPAPDRATILAVEVAGLFAPGEQPAKVTPEALTLKLGAEAGIRDLAALKDGRLLVLGGPADGGVAPFMLHLLTPATGESRPLVELRTEELGKKKGGGDEVAKAEAIAILEESPVEICLLVLYDNIPDGGPRRHRIGLLVD